MQFTLATVLVAASALTATAAPAINDAKAPALSKRFTGGQCGAHIVQYQKNEGPGADTSKYRLDIVLKDAIGDIVGGQNLLLADSFAAVSVTSELPAVFLATVGAVDDDPITFAYNGQTFSSSSGCSFGAYDSGSRQGDCGFQC